MTHAYKTFDTTSSIKSQKQIESEVFLNVTRRLKTIQHTKLYNYSSFVEAISKNRKLWTLLCTDILHPQNQLSTQIKTSIFYLNEFVQSYSGRILSEGITVEPLIDINLSIIRGLNESKVSS